VTARDVDLAQLRALAAVVDEGSFDSAASALHLTPSAVSQRIKALEQSAGRVLVQRTKPAAVTEAGHAYLRLARQIDALVHVAHADASPEEQRPVTVPLAINADSLATWVLPALAAISTPVSFDIHREDQAHSAALLRAGTVMAAITADAEPVQGCRSTRLGTMRYHPMASPDFVDRWFSDGVDARSLAVAPVVVIVLARDGVLELAQALAERPPHLRQPLWSEDQQREGQNQQDLPQLQAERHPANIAPG